MRMQPAQYRFVPNPIDWQNEYSVCSMYRAARLSNHNVAKEVAVLPILQSQKLLYFGAKEKADFEGLKGRGRMSGVSCSRE